MPVGKLYVIYGPMGSAKSLRGIEEITKRLRTRKSRTFAFTGSKTNRFNEKFCIESRIGAKLTHEEVEHLGRWPEVHDFLDSMDPNCVVLIDETHFCENLVKIVEIMLERGVFVIACGLDLSFKGTPFESPMTNTLDLLRLAPEKVERCHGVCYICDSETAIYTGKIATAGDSQEDEGADEKYHSLCRKCWQVRDKCGFK